jgi:hypothetical protein
MMNSGRCLNTVNCFLSNNLIFEKPMSMRKTFSVFFLMLAAFSFRGEAQVNVMHVDNNTSLTGKEGIFYALPRTVIRVDVTVDRIENYKGPYSEYALKYLGLKNVVEATSVEYKITDLKISTSAQPDPENYYFVELGEKSSKTEKAGLLALSESGLILGILNEFPEPENVTTPSQEPEKATATEQDVFPEIFKYSADVSFFEKVDTIIRKVNIDTMTIERQVLKRTMIEKPVEQKAKEASDFISKIKDNRFNLISGIQEVNYNKETLEYMDEQLKILQKEYMKLFTGISIHKPLSFSFTYTPGPGQLNSDVPLFKFQKSKGIASIDEPGGKAVTIRIQRSGATGTVAATIRKSEDSKKSRGFFYRVPELAKVTVKVDETLQEEADCLVNQLGVVSFLPANKWKVSFYKETGGIKSLEK